MRNVKTNVLFCLSLFLAFAVPSLTANSQGVQTFRPNVPINSNCNGFIEYLPEGYSTSGQTYPLLVFLEGIGETGDGSLADLQKLLNNGPPKYISQNNFPSSFTVNGQTHRFIIITPQIKIPIWQRYPTAQEINGIIDYAVQHYRVNTSRIYLVGISTGAGSVWNYCSSNTIYSNRLAAIAPFTGTDTPTLAKARVIAGTNLPIWAFHNRYDDGVNLKYTTGWTDTITMLSPNPLPKLTLFNASGHDSWYTPLLGSYKENNMNVYEWMLQYSRNAGPPPNQPPTANAGTDKTITLPVSSVTLNGSGNDPDGSIVSYSWSKVSGPAGGTIASPSSASTNVTNLVQGTYTFRLTVKDNSGATASDDVVVTVNAAANQSPTANAGTDKTITLPANSVTLSGSGSDPDGSIASYSWTKISGGTATITSPASASTTVTGLVQGSYVFRLTVTDNQGATASDDVAVAVNTAANQAPSANAGADKTITLPANSVTLSGSGSDPDGSIAAYSWTKVSGGAATISSPSSASTTITNLVQGSYVFRLTVTDNAGASASDDVVVTVTPQPASGSTRIEAENWTAMSGVRTTATTDEGGGLLVGWIDNGDWMDYRLTTPATGSYTLNFRLATIYSGAQFVVKNSSGQVLATVKVPTTGGFQSWQTVSATVNLPSGVQTLRLQSSAAPGWNINWWEVAGGSSVVNQPPTVSAGADKTITLPANSVTLSGSGSDPDGSIAAYSWTKVSGGAATISSPSSASTTITNLVQGSYVFRLTVTDNAGASASDDVVVTVTPQPASGSTRIEAENWTAMSGVQTTATTDEGGGLLVGWIDNGDWMDYRLTTPATGSYTLNFRLATIYSGAQFVVKNSSGQVLATVKVPTTGGFQSWQTVSATVNLPSGVQTLRLQSSAAPGWNINWWEVAGGSSVVNQPPTVSAGADKTITLPANSVTLSGSGSDPDGSIAAYSWTKVSGGAATISSPSSASTTITNLVQGSYVFRLTVTDNAGASASDDVVVTVTPQPASGSTRIEAENWTAMSGVQTTATTDEGGGLLVGWIDNGDWMDYRLTTPATGSYTLNFRLATIYSGAQFVVKNSSGQVLATVKVPTTGGFQSWQTVSATVNLPSGVQTLRLQSSAAPGWNINWLEVAGGSGNTGVTQRRATTINEQQASSLELFPNPVTEHTVLRINNSLSGNVRVQIIGMNGTVQKEFRLYKEKGVMQTKFDTGNLPAGSYIIKLTMDGWSDSKQIVKQ